MPEELLNPVEKMQPQVVQENDGAENIPARPESGLENKVSASERAGVIQEIAAAETSLPAGIVSATNARQQLKEDQQAIEKILEKDLGEIYMGMAPEKQREFKMKGEETAREINILLHKTKVQVGKIINLIIRWLSVIPGVNRFFIEQDAKIRADEILRIRMKK
jgi:hypothetical protein